MRPYANSIGSSIIEQISCLSFVSKSFSGKILSYIFGGCMLGLMSAELVIESRISFFESRLQPDDHVYFYFMSRCGEEAAYPIDTSKHLQRGITTAAAVKPLKTVERFYITIIIIINI